MKIRILERTTIRYVVDWRDGQGKHCRRYFGSLNDAELFASGLAAKVSK